jgi:DNA-binding GntR family transcriptional regulator
MECTQNVFDKVYFIKYKTSHHKETTVAIGQSTATYNYKTMAELATEAIKAAILKGDYPPGARLIPAKMEKELGLGRVAIREAIRELTGAGFLISVANKGAFVAYPPKLDEIAQIFEIKCLLESKAAELATPLISEQTMARLRQIHEQMSADLGSHDYFLLNKEFHLTIHAASGRLYLCQMIEQLTEKVYAFRSYYPFRRQDQRYFNRDHEEIIAALEQKDAQRVSELISINVRHGFETLKAIYKEGSSTST